MTISDFLVEAMENRGDEYLRIVLEMADCGARLEETLSNSLLEALENEHDLADILPGFFTDSAMSVA